MSTEKEPEIIADGPRQDDYKPISKIEEPLETQAKEFIIGETIILSEASDSSNRAGFDHEIAMASDTHVRSEAEPNLHIPSMKIFSVNDASRNANFSGENQGTTQPKQEDELEKDADSSCHDFSSSSDEPEGKNIGILESEAGAGPFDSSITFVTESETTNSSPKLTKVRSRKLFENLDDLSDALISRDKQRPEGQPVIGSHVNPVVVQEADSAFDEHSPSHRNDIWENEQWQNLPPTDIEAEGHFVEVSLHDPPRILGHPPRVRVSRDSIGSSPFQHSANISPKSASSRRLSFSSFDGGSSFASPLDSPLYQRREPLMPNAPPILMHLIDSAIQGADPSSLQRLRKVVAGEETLQQEAGDIEDWEDVAMLVVDILVAKMGGVDGLDERTETSTPRMMLGAGSAVVAGDLIPWLPSKGDSESEISPRTKMAKCLTLILQACTRNRAMCSAAGLLQVLLQAVRIILSRKMEGAVKLEAWDFNPLLDAIESLSSHCLSVLDLREWLNAISDSDAAGKSMDLILSLERAMSGEETRGPTYTFEFDGESSGLLGPGESKWPFVSGYAFATWLYIESFADTLHTAAAAAAVVAAAAAKSGRSSAISAAAAASALAGEGTAHMPRLFSFLSADNHGVEAYFHGQFLVVESASGKGKKASLHFTHAFKPRRWYFVGLEHTFKQTLIGKAESEFRLYVDGHLYETRPLEFPRVSKGLAFCCIGTNPPPTMAGLQRRRRQCPLFAEMGPIYIFREPIGQDKMARLATRGGNFLPTFGAGAGIPGLAANDQAMLFAEEGVALDSEIGPQLHLLYHPKLLVGRSCMDASPLGASGVHRRHAEVLGHVHVAARTHPTDALWAMADGGPLALLPLIVDNVDRNSLQPVLEDPNIPSAASSLSAATFRILSLALQHHGNAEEMLRYSAPQLLAHLLGKIVCAPSSGVLERTSSGKLRIEERDEELVAAVVSLCQAPKHNAALKVQLYSCLLLDLKLWCRCAYGLQKKLLSSLSDMVFTEELTMRALNAVQLLLDGCRRCYWVIPEAHSIHMFPGDRSSRHIGEINALVDELLIIIELMMGSAHDTTAAADVSCLVQFVLDCPQPNQVARVLHLLYRLVVQPNASRSSMFAELLVTNGGLEMLLALLQRESQMVDSIASVQSFTTESKLERGQDDKDEPSISTASSNSGELNTIAHGEENPVVANCNGKEESQQKSVSLTSKMIGGEHTVEESSIRSFTKLVSSVRSSAGRLYADRKIGGISLSISADSARNNFRNIDSGDGIMVGVVSLLGALVAGGHVKLSTLASSIIPQFGASSTTTIGELNPGSSIGAWILYALQKAFQAAPNRLLTDNVYTALLAAVTRSEGGTLSSEDRLAFFASGHRLEHCQLLLVLLRSLPYASRTMQLRALQVSLQAFIFHAFSLGAHACSKIYEYLSLN
ncbi:hypothetical protein O6H91_19G016400 [Diphasiastrum complanatum]|uniref:Uncharacterized protein n=3 Tax=Diphasiastrum complanatum TaxID=34168 RepID=A0ACC2AT68_DIPCM|nr:hypothetical protein O6H91_19G016400 [Diphasiastrum complanatum]KAJ7520665.1 hypothetical protein O6H91_19G016400 [Diphasiastrum complanatum]KAJ7520667.1 hypothetical protein O6H91_19G016400 [Diphasiastrum complanatum]